MPTKLGVISAIIGVLLAVFGAATMIVLGPDSQITTGPHKVESRAGVVVTSPDIVSWRGVEVTVLAEVPAQKPVFVGLGKQRDVQDYVGSTERLELTAFDQPWSSHIDHHDGEDEHLSAAPTAVDWWLDSSAGVGGSRMQMTLPNEPAQVVIASVGSSNLSGLEVTVGYGIPGGFAAGAGFLIVGIGLVLIGWLLWRKRALSWRAWREASGDRAGGDDLVMYVYVDDDGVEHEVDENRASELGLLDDDVEIVDDNEDGETT